jgi:hypothetical protein
MEIMNMLVGPLFLEGIRQPYLDKFLEGIREKVVEIWETQSLVIPNRSHFLW